VPLRNLNRRPDSIPAVKRERYKGTIHVADGTGTVYEVLHYVTVIDDGTWDDGQPQVREGLAFYRLRDGTPVQRVDDDEFEIGFVEKAHARRVG
jgi:hypothetical protein